MRFEKAVILIKWLIEITLNQSAYSHACSPVQKLLCLENSNYCLLYVPVIF